MLTPAALLLLICACDPGQNVSPVPAVAITREHCLPQCACGCKRGAVCTCATGDGVRSRAGVGNSVQPLYPSCPLADATLEVQYPYGGGYCPGGRCFPGIQPTPAFRFDGELRVRPYGSFYRDPRLPEPFIDPRFALPRREYAYPFYPGGRLYGGFCIGPGCAGGFCR